jgi:hypothetical protein
MWVNLKQNCGKMGYQNKVSDKQLSYCRCWCVIWTFTILNSLQAYRRKARKLSKKGIGLISTGKAKEAIGTVSGRTGRPVGRPPLHGNTRRSLSDDDNSVRVFMSWSIWVLKDHFKVRRTFCDWHSILVQLFWLKCSISILTSCHAAAL